MDIGSILQASADVAMAPGHPGDGASENKRSRSIQHDGASHTNQVCITALPGMNSADCHHGMSPATATFVTSPSQAVGEREGVPSGTAPLHCVPLFRPGPLDHCGGTLAP